MPEWTADKMLTRWLDIAQPEIGYRFSVDALILAHRINPSVDDHIADIGTGCGVIPLILARRFPDVTICGIEVQPELASLAESNASNNHLADRIRIIEKDVRTVTACETGPVDIVTCNPPHTPKSAGRRNPNPQMAIARHEIMLTISDLAAAAYRLLSPKGRFFTIYPARRLTEILLQLRSTGLEPKQIRAIHFKSDTPARRILVQAAKNGQPGIEIAPPLVMHKPDGAYTSEAMAIITPGDQCRSDRDKP